MLESEVVKVEKVIKYLGGGDNFTISTRLWWRAFYRL